MATTQGAAASLTVVSFAGVDTTGTNGSGAIGATGSGSAATGAPTASLVSTRANSFVFGVGLDWDAGPARTLGANQTMVHQYAATNVITAWVQRTTSPVAASGTTVTINDTAPTADRYNLTICEILPPGTPTWTVSGAVTPAASGVGTTLALSQVGRGVSRWNLATGQRQQSNGYTNYAPEHLAFTPDGQTVMGIGVGELLNWKFTGGITISGSNNAGGFGSDGLVVLEADHDVVRITHDHHVAGSLAPSPARCPEIEDVVQVDVGQKR